MEIDLEAIFRTFAAEAEEHLARMEECLIALENNADDQRFLEEIFRGAHTIKGNAASLGFNTIAKFAHAFEELLQSLRSHEVAATQDSVDLLLRSVDALRAMIPEALAGAVEIRPQHQVLLDQLSDYDAKSQSENIPSVSAAKPSAEHADRHAEDFGPRADQPDTVRVDVQKLDRMLNLAGEIAVAHSRLRQSLVRSSQGDADTLEAHAQLERLSLDLQEQILKARTVPVGPIFHQCLRTVRDGAQASGKDVRLTIDDRDVEIDLSMVERLKDPLTHLIRNAIDHGIETPEVRSAQGKESTGSITLKAFYEGAGVVIQLGDDGAGFNRARIAERARTLGLAVEPERLADQDLWKFVFEPGFSTAENVTGLSGRGVGMDVVRRNIENLHGSITVDSQARRGATISIRVPLTLAIIDGFGVSVGEETYILPLDRVLECIDLPVEESSKTNTQGIINLRGEPLPYVRLGEWFGLSNPRPARQSVVVIGGDDGKAGLAVDRLHGTGQTVIKPLAKGLQEVPGISASAVLGDGRVALILDVSALLREVVRKQDSYGAPNRDYPAKTSGLLNESYASTAYRQ